MDWFTTGIIFVDKRARPSGHMLHFFNAVSLLQKLLNF